MIWFLLIFGLAVADKLDRTYLPPPGFKLSGGSPGAIQAPLEYPKTQYISATDEYLANPEIAVGINRVAPNRPAGTIVPINNPSISLENNYYSSTTINPYPQNNNVPSLKEHSTSRPIDYTSKYNDDVKRPVGSEYFNREQIQDQGPSISVAKEFQTTQSSPRLDQIAPISDISRNDYYANRYFNQSKPDGELDSIIGTVSKSTPFPQLDSYYKSNQFDSSEYSSIPTTQAYSSVISSTISPSTANYDYSTTTAPNQFYPSTSKPPQLSTTKPIYSKYSPAPNYTLVKMRPERVQAQADREASILNYESRITPEGYSYTYDTSNGIHADETGVTVNGVKAKGSYSYIGDDGKLYNVVYTADENGFQPRGDHLPTSPPIPEAILRVIEQVTKEREAGITDDGSYDENKYGYRRYHNGFYSPKSVVPKQYSIAGYKQNPITKNVISNYDRAVNSQIPSKTETVPNVYQNVISSDSTTSRPVTDNYLNTDKYIKNIDTLNAQKPYPYNDESIIKNVGPFKGNEKVFSSQPNEGDANNKISNQQNVYKQVITSPIVENAKTKLVNAQAPLNKNLVGYDGFVENNNNQNEPYEYDNKETFSAESGYQYNPPHFKGNDDFRSGFFDTYDVRNKTFKQDESNIATPKPFQTPDVSRIDDETHDYDYYENVYEDSEEHKKEPQKINMYPLDSGVHYNGNVPHKKLGTIGIQRDNIPSLKNYDNHLQTVSDGYPYQQRVFGKQPYNQSPNLYSTSTVVPTEFTSRITMLQTQEPELNIGRMEADQKSTKYTPNEYQTNLQYDKTNKLPDYSTIRPGYTNGKPVNIPTGSNLNPQAELKETNLNIDFATTVPSIENSYAPNIDIYHSDEHNTHSTTDKIIGEDFTGPKQPQRFDPITGYHY